MLAVTQRPLDPNTADDSAVEKAHGADADIGLHATGFVFPRHGQANAGITLAAHRTQQQIISLIGDLAISCRRVVRYELCEGRSSPANTAAKTQLGIVTDAASIEIDGRDPHSQTTVPHRQVHLEWCLHFSDLAKPRLTVVATH